MKLPVKATETKSGKGKVIDAYGFSVCNTGGGSYAEQRMVAAQIAKAVNYHDRLVETLRASIDNMRASAEKAGPLHAFWDDIFSAEALLTEMEQPQ